MAKQNKSSNYTRVSDKKVFKLIKKGLTNAEICQETGIADRTARDKRQKYNEANPDAPIFNRRSTQEHKTCSAEKPPLSSDSEVEPGIQEHEYEEHSNDNATFRAKVAVPVESDAFGNTLIHTIEELLEMTQIDTDVWEPHNIKVKAYQGFYKAKKVSEQRHTGGGLNLWDTAVTGGRVQLYSVSCSLRKRRNVNPDRIKEFLIESWGEGPKYEPFKQERITDGHLLEIGLFDPHLGKLCWREETGQDLDINISIAKVYNAVQDIVNRTRHMPIERILLPVGNDFFHTDSPKNQTYSGTPLDVDSRFHKVFMKGLRMMIDIIEKLRLIAPVDILCIPGNHDTQSSWQLAVALHCQFSNCDNVEVDINASHFKYYQWGQNLIGFVHGDKIPKKRRNGGLHTIMQADQREAWGETWFHEWHTGHVHNMSVEEFPGVRVRTLSALTATDAWHHNSGWLGALQGVEAFVYHAERGLVDHPLHSLIPTKENNDCLIKRDPSGESQEILDTPILIKRK